MTTIATVRTEVMSLGHRRVHEGASFVKMLVLWQDIYRQVGLMITFVVTTRFKLSL